MIDGARTWALVVGIDVYADPAIPALTGAANDAVAAVRWLRALGVPDSNILLHVAPCAAAARAVDALGLAHSMPTLDNIWTSVGVLEANSGDRLFVFLSGHGFYEPTKGRLFLTQNAEQRSMTNMGIDLWISYFRSLRYTWQFLVMDGCQNYPYTPTQRMKVDAALYPGVAPPMPLPGNALMAFFAAAQGEIVPEINGRGAYMRRFFEFADPARPIQDAVTLDFVTGRKSVPARLAHSYIARAAAADAAALRPSVSLHPGVMPCGRAEALEDMTLFELPDEPTSSVAVMVRPTDAIRGITNMRLRCVRSPYWERRLPVPPATAVTVPVNNRLPRGLELVIDIDLEPSSSWAAARFDVKFRTDVDRQIDIDLADLIGRLPDAATGQEVAVLLTVDQAGLTRANEIPSVVYDAIEQQAAATMVAGSPVRLTRHETGPDLVLAAGTGTGSRLLDSMADQIIRATPPRVAVATAMQRNAPDTTAIRFVITEADAKRLAGPLWSLLTVGITAPGAPGGPVWSSGRGRSLMELAAHPFVGVAQGAHEIRVELPWGSWSHVVDVPRDEVVSVTLPSSVGRPPLRALLGDEWPWDAAVVVADGPAPTAADLHDEQRGRSRALSPVAPPTHWGGVARHVYRLPGGQLPKSQRLIHLAWSGGPHLRFPARLDGQLGVQVLDILDGTARVEPLVHFAQPLWDLLVSTGRLDALTPEQAHELSYGKWEDPILGLAAAYALQSTYPTILPVVLQNLRRLGMTYPDIVILEATSGLAGLNDAGAREEALRELAAASVVPVLRWGVPLARLLLARHPIEVFANWDSFLAGIERQLSAHSIWTVWSSRDT